MRDRKEIVGEATTLKNALVKRLKRMLMHAENMAKYDGCAAPDIKDDRLTTMNTEYEILAKRQILEAQRYATLRWVLGITEEIDPSNLELDK